MLNNGQRKSWSEMSTWQKVAIQLAAAVQLALLAAAQWDLTKRSDDELNGSKSLSRAITFVNFIGPLAYFMVGRKDASLALPRRVPVQEP